MAKTFLQVINEVHKYLRRDEDGAGVASITADADTVLISAFVNQAKQRVEGKWKWNTQRATITFNSVASTHSYDTSSALIATVTQTNERSSILRYPDDTLLFWDVTTSAAGFRMGEIPRDYALDSYRGNSAQVVTAPDLVAVYRTGNGLTCFFPVAPVGVRNYSFEVHNPQDELAVAATNVTAPWRPIALLAASLAAEERGDAFGVSPARLYDLYEQSIEEEIAFDKVIADDDALEPV